jgi:hypothetical protein
MSFFERAIQHYVADYKPREPRGEPRDGVVAAAASTVADARGTAQ